MVTAELSQLSAECSTWRASLRNWREDLSTFTENLQEITNRVVSRSAMEHIEHFQNQFKVQLYNVHNLKQAVKEHERIADWEIQRGTANAELVWAKHADLYQQFQSLHLTLQSLKEEFNQFASQVN